MCLKKIVQMSKYCVNYIKLQDDVMSVVQINNKVQTNNRLKGQ